jgi:hypothetical protein
MQILIKIETEKTIMLTVTATDKIRTVKALIYADEGVKPKDQRLIFQHHATSSSATTTSCTGPLFTWSATSLRWGRLVIRLAAQSCKRRRLLEQLARLDDEGDEGSSSND